MCIRDSEKRKHKHEEFDDRCGCGVRRGWGGRKNVNINGRVGGVAREKNVNKLKKYK